MSLLDGGVEAAAALQRVRFRHGPGTWAIERYVLVREPVRECGEWLNADAAGAAAQGGAGAGSGGGGLEPSPELKQCGERRLR